MPLDNQDPEQIKQWLNIFGDDQKPSQVSLLGRLKFWFVQTMLGMGKVSGIDRQTGKNFLSSRNLPKVY